jgi:hypothetical protein
MRRFALAFGAAGFMVSAALCSSLHAQQFPLPRNKINPDVLSQGAKAWWLGPNTSGGKVPAAQSLRFGTNVDANNPNSDLAAGQSETAIAAHGSRVVAAWNDATGFLVQPSTEIRASLTGVGISFDGGTSFRDLLGLRNNNPDEQWFGDPSVVAVDANNFIVGSLYFPANGIGCSTATGPLTFDLAVEVLHVDAAGNVTFSRPIVTARGHDLCTFPPDVALNDKPFLSYDPSTRTLAMSYTRFFLHTPHTLALGRSKWYAHTSRPTR